MGALTNDGVTVPGSISTLGRVVPDHSVRFLGHDTHQHDVPHLIYVVSGVAILTADDLTVPLRAQEAAWLQPHVPHAVRMRPGAMVLGPMLEDEASPTTRVRLLGVAAPVVEAMTATLVAAPETREQVLPFRRALGQALLNLAQPYFTVPLPEHPAALLLAQEALRHPLPLAELARRHRMSARQVQRIFLAETGFSFSRWRTRARLNAAIDHLQGGGELLGAAPLAGFSSRTGLLKALSRETGADVAALSQDPRAALTNTR